MSDSSDDDLPELTDTKDSDDEEVLLSTSCARALRSAINQSVAAGYKLP